MFCLAKLLQGNKETKINFGVKNHQINASFDAF
jgi:hypothetical protein